MTPLSNLESLPESLRDRKLAALHAATVEQKLAGDFSRLVAPITVGGMARGYLSMIGETGKLDALDSLVVEQGALVCAVEMSRTKAVREAEKRLKGDLLNALLQENLSPLDAQLWAQNMGLDLSEAQVAMRFAWLGAASPSRRRLETLVNGEVSRLNMKVIANPLGAEIVCFCQVPRGSHQPDTAIQLAQAVMDQGGREYPDTLLLCGLGAPFAGYPRVADFLPAGRPGIGTLPPLPGTETALLPGPFHLPAADPARKQSRVDRLPGRDAGGFAGFRRSPRLDPYTAGLLRT